MQKKNKGKAIHIGKILNSVLRSYGQDMDGGLFRIINAWEDVVDPAVSKNASPVAMNNNTLVVHVTSSPWMQQLQFLKKEILQKLNQAVGQNQIQNIRFKIGPISPDRKNS